MFENPEYGIIMVRKEMCLNVMAGVMKHPQIYSVPTFPQNEFNVNFYLFFKGDLLRASCMQRLQRRSQETSSLLQLV